MYSLYTITRWELIRIIRGRDITRRIVLPQLLFLAWLVINGAVLPWILQFTTVMLTLMLGAVAMLLAGYIADSFAGESERATIETLLLSPTPDWAIVGGKACALLLLGLLLFGLTLVAYGITVALFRLPGPGSGWYGQALYAGIVVYTTIINLGLVVSWSAPSVQAAQQTLLYPIVGIAIAAVLLPTLAPAALRTLAVLPITGLAVAGGVVAVASFVIVVRLFHRDRLLLR